MNPYILGGGASAACTYTQKDAPNGTSSASAIGYSTSIFGKGVSWTTGSGYTLKRFTTIMYRTGDPYTNTTFDSVTAQICDDDGGTPPKPTNCTTADAVVSTEGMATASGTQYEFNIAAGKALTTGTRYWMLLYPTSGVGDASNYVNVKWTTSGGTENAAGSNNTLTWLNSDTDIIPNIVTYSCE